MSLPTLPSTVSSPLPPMSVSAPLPPLIASRPSPPSAVSREESGERARAQRVVAAEPVDGQPIVGSLRLVDVHLLGEPGDLDGSSRSRSLDDVRSRGAVDDDDVGGDVPDPADAEPDVDEGDAAPGQVVEGRRVGAAERIDVQRLRGEEVESAVDPDMAGRRPRGDAERVGAAGAVHGDRVEPRAGSDLVGAVAGVPREGVVAGAQEHLVGPCVPIDDVVARAAVQRLGEAPADERVDAVAAVERRLLRVGEGARGLVDAEPVVAAAAVDHDPREAAAEEGEVGAPVVLDVDHEAPAGGRSQADPLTRAGARDSQPPVRDRCVHRRLRLRRQAERGRQDGGGDQNA